MNSTPAITMPIDRFDGSAPRAIPSAVLGTMLFVFTEIMFFGGLISAYLVLRAAADAWPPADQPRLPVVVTGINSLILLASAVTVWRTKAAAVSGDRSALLQWLSVTLILGSTFIIIQGVEWARLISYGLTAESSMFGGVFYTVIGMHALHVLAAVLVLARVLLNAINNKYTSDSHDGILAMRLFWFFVVGIWPILYVLVYLW